MHAFEISSGWLTFGPLYKVLRSLKDVSDVKRNWFDDDRISFIYGGELFVINEPWGDNSRYWVGPKNPENSKVDIAPLHEAFKNGNSHGCLKWLWGG